MTREEAIAYNKNLRLYMKLSDKNRPIKFLEENYIALEMAIQALEQTRWIPVSECGYPKPEDEYKHFLTIDNKGEITIQEFLLSLDEEPQPYFTGWRNIIAYMLLPEPYKVESEG